MDVLSQLGEGFPRRWSLGVYRRQLGIMLKVVYCLVFFFLGEAEVSLLM